MATDEEEIKCKHLLCWSGEHGIELFNSWDMMSEESADKQLRLMNTEVQSINVPKGYQSEETNVQSLRLAQVDRRPAGSPAKNATCLYCQKRDT